MRYLVSLLVFLSIAGCGTTSSVKFPPTSDSEQAAFLMVDKRSEQGKNSYQEINTGGKNHFFGDDNIKPSPLELLKNTLIAELNDELLNKKVTLTEFIINVREPEVHIDQNAMDAASSSSLEAALVAPLAEVFISAIEGMRSEKSLYILVSGDVDGSSFSESQYASFGGRVTENNIKETVNKVLDDVVGKVKAITTNKSLTHHSNGTPNGAP